MNEISSSEQQKNIWNHFQNNDPLQFSGNRPRLMFLLRKIISLKPPSAQIRVLNIGAGNGTMELLSLQTGYDTYSLDLSPETVLKLKGQGINAHTGSITKTSFPDAQFDVIIATEVLEHLATNDLKLALTEIKRLLKPNGFFIGTVPYEENLSDNKVYCPGCHLEFHRWGHQQSFSISQLKQTLSEYLNPVEIYRRSFIDWQSRSLKQLIKGIIRYLIARLGIMIAQPNIFFLCKR